MEYSFVLGVIFGLSCSTTKSISDDCLTLNGGNTQNLVVS